MNEKIYLHSICADKYGYSSKNTLRILKNILEANAVLSASKRGVEYIYNFSGKDYVSLSDYEKRNIYKKDEYNGYYQYTIRDTSIVFPKGAFEVIIPTLLENRIIDYDYPLDAMQKYGLLEERFSDLPDEVQVKDEVSLKHMIALTLPSSEIINYWFSINKNIDILKREVEKYKKLLYEYGKDVPIYDINTFKSLEEEDNVKEIVYVLKSKNKLF